MGQLDAVMAASTIRKYKPKIVYSSDLDRDAETADIIANLLGNLPVDIDFDLRTANMGSLSGMAEQEAAPAVRNWYENPWTEAPGGGESNNAFLRRFYSTVDSKLNLARKVETFKPSVFVTHGRNLAALHARSEMLPQWEANMPMPGGCLFLYDDGHVEFTGETEPILSDV